MKAAAPAGRPPSSGAPSSSSSLGGVQTPGFRPGCPSWKEGSGVRSAPRVQEARQRPHPRRVPWGAVRAGRGPHSSHALPGAGRSETGPGCGATRSSQVWASASRVPAFQTFPPAVLLATLGGTEGGRSGPCSLGTGTQNPRARAGGDRGLGVSVGGGEHFAGQLASGRRDSRAAGEAQPLQLRGAQGGPSPPPQAWTAPPGHLAHFAGSWFQAGLSGAAGEPGSLSGQRPIGSGGGCQSAWTVSRASASAPNGCPHPHRQRACLQSRVPHTCLPRGGRGDLSGRQSAQPALPLGSRARAAGAPRLGASAPRRASLCAG